MRYQNTKTAVALSTLVVCSLLCRFGLAEDMTTEVKEFRDQCEKYVMRITKMRKPPPGSYDRMAEYIARHLGSQNDEIRKIAITGLRTILLSSRPAPANVCLKFLDKEYPVEVRAIALATVIWKSNDKNENVKNAFVELVCGKVSPPHVDVICLSVLKSWGGFTLSELVPDDKKRLVVRRMLESVSRLERKRWWFLQRPFEFGESVTGPVIVNWYATEPDVGARAALFDHRVARHWRRWPTTRKKIIELGLADWDPKIRELARKASNL